MSFRKAALIFTHIALLVCFNSGAVFAAIVDKEANDFEPLALEWRFKRKITIENPGIAVTEAVIQIQFSNAEFDYTKAKAGGADIRFSTTSGKQDAEGLSYWIEQWNKNGVTRIWVKVPALRAKAQNSIYIFYGNSQAQPVSNGSSTFLFFDDFEDGDFSKKWISTSIGEDIEEGGLLKLKETDGQDGTIATNFDVTGNMIVRTSYQRGGGDGHWVRAGVGGWNNWLCIGDHTHEAASGINYVMLFDSVSIGSLKTAPLVKEANSVITDQWRRVAYWYDGKHLRGKQDEVTVEWPAANASSKLALRTLDNDSWDLFAYITVSPYLNFEPKIALGPQENN